MTSMLCRLRAIAFVCALTPIATGAQDAPEYPVKVVNIIVPFAAGGAADVLARLVADRFHDMWDKPVIVVTRPGAGGIIGTEALARSEPDGHTLEIVTVGHAANPRLYDKLPYDTEADFAPVGLVAVMPNVVAVHPSVPAKTVRELIELARARPGKLLYGSPGNATTSHMATALFSQMAHIEMMHVPYNGQAASENALVDGEIQVLFDTIIGTMQYVRSGRMRALAVTTSKRSPLVPDLPTVSEAALPGYEFEAWFALLAPAKTPAAIVAKLNRDLNRALQSPVMNERLTALGAEPGGGTQEDLRGLLKKETERWAKVIKEADIKVQ